MTSAPVEPTDVKPPVLNEAKYASTPISTGSGTIPGSVPQYGEESYIDTNAVEEFSSSTFAQLREKSDMGAEAVGRASASALGTFPEAVQALAVHDKIRKEYLRRFGQLSGFITDSEKQTGRILVGYDRLDREGRASFSRVPGQEI